MPILYYLLYILYYMPILYNFQPLFMSWHTGKILKSRHTSILLTSNTTLLTEGLHLSVALLIFDHPLKFSWHTCGPLATHHCAMVQWLKIADLLTSVVLIHKYIYKGFFSTDKLHIINIFLKNIWY